MKGTSRQSPPSDLMAKANSSFPACLYRMLNEAESFGFNHIVGWIDQEHFRVFDRERFEAQVLPFYFKATKFKSFRRQLNLYCFVCARDSNSPLKGSYSRPDFRKDHADFEAIYLHRKSGASTRSVTKAKTPARARNLDCKRGISLTEVNGGLAEKVGFQEEEIGHSNALPAVVLRVGEDLVSRKELCNMADADAFGKAPCESPVPLDVKQVLWAPGKDGMLSDYGQMLVDWASTVPEDLQIEILSTFRRRDAEGEDSY